MAQQKESIITNSKYILHIVFFLGFVVPILIINIQEYIIYKDLGLSRFWEFWVMCHKQSGVIICDVILLIVLTIAPIFLYKYRAKNEFSRIFLEMSTAANIPIIVINKDKSVYWTNMTEIKTYKDLKLKDLAKIFVNNETATPKIEECLKTGQNISYEIERKIGDKKFWMHVALTKLNNKKNSMVCATISDLSNMKEASEKIDNQQRELQMQNEMLTLITAQMEVQQAGIKEQNDLLSTQHKQLEEQAKELKNAFDELEIRNKQITTKTNYITDSIKYAQTIQEAMLPDTKQLENFFDNFVIYRPKDIVSGDFYWMSINEKYTYVVLGDCTGHGVPGAFMSMIGIRLLGELINEIKIERPSDILEAMHLRIQAALKQDITENNDGMDIAICRFKKVDEPNHEWELKYAGAKQPIYIKRKDNDEVEVVEADRRGIGGQSFADVFFFEDRDMDLNAGDRIYLTSDGIKDQNNLIRKRFGTNRMKMMISTTSTKDIRDQKMFMQSILRNWQGCEEQRDDISLWGFELGDHALQPYDG